MPIYVAITNDGIEKLKDKVSSKILLYLKERASRPFNESKQGKFKKKLKSFGAKEEDITFIINCFNTFERLKEKPEEKPEEKQKEILEERIKRKLRYIVQNEIYKKYKSSSPQQYSHSSHLPDVYRSLPRANYKDDT